MPIQIELLQEAERRGILPPEKKAMLNEAIRRGLINGSEQPQAEQLKPVQSISRTGLDQSLQGATLGFADEVSDRIGASVAKISDFFRDDDEKLFKGRDIADIIDEARGITKERLTEQFEQNPGTSITANIAGGVLTGGAAASTKAGTALANSLRAGNIATRAGKAGALSAAAAAGFRAGGADEGERLEALKDVSSVDFVGAAIPVAGATAGAVKRAVVPKIDEALKPLAQRAKDFGIPLRLDQVSPTKARKTIQKISQDLPFSGVDDFEQVQRKAFTRAVSKTIGQDSDVLDADTINAFISSAEKKFGGVLKDKSIKVEADDIRKISKIGENVDKFLGSNLSNIVKKNVDDVVQDISGGVSGEKLANIRSGLVKKIPKVEGEAKVFVGEIVDKIDDVVAKNATKTELKILKQARREWRNFKTIEPLLEKSTDGLINPTQLKTRVAASKFIKSSRKKVGEDDLVDLANIGKEFLPKLGGSDTFSKGAIAGAGLSTATGFAAPLTTAGTLAANRGLQAANSSQRLVDAALKASGSAPRITKNPLIAISGSQAAAQ